MTAVEGRSIDRADLPPNSRECNSPSVGQTTPRRRPVVVTPAQAATLVQSGDTILINGSGGGVGTPERLCHVANREHEVSAPLELSDRCDGVSPRGHRRIAKRAVGLG
jgi:hypothetical protein